MNTIRLRHPASLTRGGTAFTLVELLVVIGVIAVLIGMLLPALNKAREQARGVYCMANLRNIGQTLMMYVNDNKGYYPTSCYAGGGKTSPHAGYAVYDFANPAVYNNWDFLKNVDGPGMNFLGGLIRINRSLLACLRCPSSEPWQTSDQSKPLTSYLVNGLMISRKASKLKRPTEIAVLQEDRFCFDTSYMRPARHLTGSYVTNYLRSAGLDTSYRSPYNYALVVPFKLYDKGGNGDYYNYWAWQPTGSIAEYGNIHNHGANFLMADGHAEWLRYQDIHARIFGLTGGGGGGINGTPEDTYYSGPFGVGINPTGTTNYYRSAID